MAIYSSIRHFYILIVWLNNFVAMKQVSLRHFLFFIVWTPCSDFMKLLTGNFSDNP